MKVIGKSQNGFILDASSQEVARLIGYYSSYEKGATSSVGDEIQVDKMYEQLYKLEHNQPELRKVVDTLRGLADLLEPVCPVLEKQIEEAAAK